MHSRDELVEMGLRHSEVSMELYRSWRSESDIDIRESLMNKSTYHANMATMLFTQANTIGAYYIPEVW